MENYLLKLEKKKKMLELLIQKRDILLKSNESELSEEQLLLKQKEQLKKEIEKLEEQEVTQQKNWKTRKNKKWKDITIIPNKPLIFMFALIFHSKILFTIVILSLSIEASIIIAREIKQLAHIGNTIQIFKTSDMLRQKEEELEKVKERLKEIQNSLKDFKNNLERLNLKTNELRNEIDSIEFILFTTRNEVLQNETVNKLINDAVAKGLTEHPELQQKLSILELRDYVQNQFLKQPQILKMEQAIIGEVFGPTEDYEENLNHDKNQKKNSNVRGGRH